MSDDLVKRLRDREDYAKSNGWNGVIFGEAADRIERLEKALREIASPNNWEGMDWISHGVPKWIARAALEEKDNA
jgi:hypothetical protein